MDFDSVARQAETWLDRCLVFYTRMLPLINSARTAGAVFLGAFHICKIDIEYCVGLLVMLLTPYAPQHDHHATDDDPVINHILKNRLIKCFLLNSCMVD